MQIVRQQHSSSLHANATCRDFGAARGSGTLASFGRNEELFGEDEPAEYFYRVVSGWVRTYRILADGRRQIAGFYLTGEAFGLEAGGSYTCSAEAINDVKVMAYKRAPIVALAASDRDVATELWTLTTQELRRAQKHALLLVQSAQERVAGFLLDLAQRTSTAGDVAIPMPRQDIADYLGLTIETVSRMLSKFKRTAVISLPSSRQVQIHRSSTLQRLNT